LIGFTSSDMLPSKTEGISFFLTFFFHNCAQIENG
jgi:hypothetical protein